MGEGEGGHWEGEGEGKEITQGFVPISFLTLSYKVTVQSSSGHRLIFMQRRAGPRVRQVRYLNAKCKGTPIVTALP